MRPTAVLLATLLVTSLAGCLGGDGSTTDTAQTLPAPVPTTDILRVPLSGGTDLAMCLPDCDSGTLVVNGNLWEFVQIPSNATVRGLDLTITWDPATAATDTLSLDIQGGGERWGVFHHHVEGPSPLRITDNGTYQDLKNLYIQVAPAESVAGARVMADQDFRGELVLILEILPGTGDGGGAPCTRSDC